MTSKKTNESNSTVIISANEVQIMADGTSGQVTINNLVTPVNNTDAANKKYVDDAIAVVRLGAGTQDIKITFTKYYTACYWLYRCTCRMDKDNYVKYAEYLIMVKCYSSIDFGEVTYVGGNAPDEFTLTISPVSGTAIGATKSILIQCSNKNLRNFEICLEYLSGGDFNTVSLSKVN
jgi:folate-dependent tRNA-U54 methylase TrmFO/GidA